jgi:hypothetical protein
LAASGEIRIGYVYTTLFMVSSINLDAQDISRTSGAKEQTSGPCGVHKTCPPRATHYTPFLK